MCASVRLRLLAPLLAGALLCGPSAVAGRTVVQTVTGRTGRFRCERTLVEARPDGRTWRVVYPSPSPPGYPEGRRAVAWYYEPAWPRAAKGPAVMCLHILSGDGALTMSLAARFAACGLPALMPEMPFFRSRIPGGGGDPEAALRRPEGPRLLAESLLAGPGEMLRAADVLAACPGVDPDRLRVMGTSLGGILAVTAAGRDARFEKAAFLLAGGDLKGLLASSARPEIRPLAAAVARADARTHEMFEAAWRMLEPTGHAARLAGRVRAGNVRMFNVAEDEVIPPANTRALARALGLRAGPLFEVRPGLGHYTAAAALPGVVDELATWFGGRVPPPGAGTRPIRAVFGEIHRLLAWDSRAGGDVRVAATLVVRSGDEETLRLPLALGRLTGGVAQVVGACAPGFVEYMAAARELTAYMARQGSLGPFARLLPIALETGRDGARRVIVRSRWGFGAEIALAPGRDAPAALRARFGRTQVEIDVAEWTIANE